MTSPFQFPVLISFKNNLVQINHSFKTCCGCLSYRMSRQVLFDSLIWNDMIAYNDYEGRNAQPKKD